MSTRWFVAGTDTGIGKTHAACTLLHALRATGRTTCGMKPVASGCMDTPEGLRNEDALALLAAGSAPLPYASINPVAFARAVVAAPGRGARGRDHRTAAATRGLRCAVCGP
jgi:dethiobiotin synthetase